MPEVSKQELYSLIRNYDKDQNINIKSSHVEQRASTDSTIKLILDMESKIREQITKSVIVGDNIFKDYYCDISYCPRAKCPVMHYKFMLNGYEYTGDIPLELDRDWET